MAKEVLYVPEDKLAEVILVIRTGLHNRGRGEVSRDTVRSLTQWCKEEEEYLRRMSDDSED